MADDKISVIVAQLGAREHYQVPRLCHAHGALVRMHTDFWRPLPSVLKPIFAMAFRKLEQRISGRSSPDIPDELVIAHSIQATYWRIYGSVARDRCGKFEVYRRWGEEFAKRVAKSLSMEEFSVFFGFSSASLEALEETRRLGAFAVLDEIAPTHRTDRIVAEEQSRFPKLEPSFYPIPRPFLERLQAEWEVADRIIVNSEWTRSALREKRVPDDKIRVVPIPYRSSFANATIKIRRKKEPLCVLWLGTLCLGKGLPYAIEAARRLLGMPVRFTFAGPLAVNLSSIEWPENSTYVGQVPRTEVSALWLAHHVYVLPTLSDGFAITQIEAMAHGLPIIVTPNCGDVVEDGRSGVLVPPRDSRALADAVLRFLDGELDLEAASRAAIKRSEAFRPEAIWPVLRSALTPSSLRDGSVSQ